jgi:hypothetical protein
VDCAEEVLADLLMTLDVAGLVRAAVDVEFDAQALEIPDLAFVVEGGQLLDGLAFTLGPDQGRDAVIVTAADETSLVAPGSQVAHEGVGR